jgi:ribosomal protein S18 acetylase RimI-like enzyme
VTIRPVTERDFDRIWPVFEAVCRAGDTYGYDPATTREQALSIWLEQPQKTFLAESAGEVLGTYYLKPNQAGPGGHVCNCGYMVAEAARGRGVATAMCEHSQRLARELGYKAMQFNFVASSNTGALRLWQKLGFKTVGRLPDAFDHPELGFIDALVLYKWLEA